MAAVTYNGVEGAEGGSIFRDLKIWVALRVPMRALILDKITRNGGTVVPLEKQADILIADHIRKDAPAGSYSWKFIDDSVNNGIIQLKDRYRIGPDPELPRPTGVGRGAKATRTPFTTAEDALVAKWALDHPVDRTGNKIWQEFETMYPRHTWQSWRNRFVKTLQSLPMDKLLQMAASASEEPVQVQQRVEATVPPPPKKVIKEVAHRPAKKTKPSPVKPAEQPRTVSELDEPIQDDPRQDDGPDHDQPSDTETSTGRKVFYEDLNDYMITSGLDINTQLKIDGKTIDLYDLAQVVQPKQGDPPEELDEEDWAEVAEDLGFSGHDEDIVTQLRQCYNECLAEFLKEMESFESEEVEIKVEEESHGPSPGPEDVPYVGELAEEPWTEDTPSRQTTAGALQSYERSSPPIAAKRALDQRPLSSSGPLIKRRRYNKRTEIPSTPEMDRMGVSEASQQLPPLRRPQEDEDDDDDDDELQDEDQTDLADRIRRLEARESTLPQQESPLLGTVNTRTSSQNVRVEPLNTDPIPFNIGESHQNQTAGALTRPDPKSKRRSEPGPSTQGRVNGSGKKVAAAKTPPSTVEEPKPRSRRSLPSSFNTDSRPKPSAPPPTLARTDAPTHSRSPVSHTTPKPEPAPPNHREIDRWIRHYESLGFPRPIVVEGLKRTTLTPGSPASLVMQSLKDGADVPSHHEGIWTDRDDDELALIASVDLRIPPIGIAEERRYRKVHKATDRLMDKHGPAKMTLRKEFIEALSSDRQGEPGS
ncbi:hypothetical protein AK830_g3972 [Neonectria ditissima]|uniref:DNA-binding protein RAP1 n=1 Tax=Neonectria ditissima TaxID=78410 RepID=A0A0P7B7K0_9HYPO|nr:hypothetical protein AK830_g3972 [Neonectria ditissima]